MRIGSDKGDYDWMRPSNGLERGMEVRTSSVFFFATPHLVIFANGKSFQVRKSQLRTPVDHPGLVKALIIIKMYSTPHYIDIPFI